MRDKKKCQIKKREIERNGRKKKLDIHVEIANESKNKMENKRNLGNKYLNKMIHKHI